MLGYADYLVLASTLIISSIIGIYYRHQNNAKDYLLAGGSMSPLPVAFSLMASFMSAITLLGVTFENYTFGTQFMVINLSYAIGKINQGHRIINFCEIYFTKKKSPCKIDFTKIF